VLIQSAKNTVVDNGPQWAAAIAFYALLSAVPVLLGLATVVSFIGEPLMVQRQLIGMECPKGDRLADDVVDRCVHTILHATSSSSNGERSATVTCAGRATEFTDSRTDTR